MTGPALSGPAAAALAGLAPDRAPPPPGWWPPAPGWWLVAIVIAAAVAGALWWLRRRRADPMRRLQKAALHELDRLAQADIDEPALARGLEHLTRRYAIGRFGREAVARLSGDAWLAFVVAHGAVDWSGDNGRKLLRAAYGGHTDEHAGDVRASWLAGTRALLQGCAVKGAR